MLALAKTFNKNAVSLAVAQTSYKQNVVAVNTLVTSVLTPSLPILNQNPPDWNEFVSAYEKADAGALTWLNNVMARLLHVPDEVSRYNSIVTQLLADAKAQGETLVKDPSNQTALDILNTDLDNLNKQMGLVVTFITGALNAIKGFKDVLPTMTTNLQTIADDSTKAANADQTQIDKLNQDIDNLHAEIKSLTAAIVALGIADGIALTLGVVATIAAFPEGALVWFVLGPAIAVASTYIAIDGLKIKADNAAIKGDEKQITGLTADVSTLHILSKNFASMSAQTVEIESNLQAILNEWQSLENDFNTAVTDIKNAVADASSANFNAVVAGLDDVIAEWAAAYEQAGDLHLDLNVNDAQLTVGMSSAEVQQATAKGTTSDIITYYNKVQNQRAKAVA
jgi:hypothetical protein